MKKRTSLRKAQPPGLSKSLAFLALLVFPGCGEPESGSNFGSLPSRTSASTPGQQAQGQEAGAAESRETITNGADVDPWLQDLIGSEQTASDLQGLKSGLEDADLEKALQDIKLLISDRDYLGIAADQFTSVPREVGNYIFLRNCAECHSHFSDLSKFTERQRKIILEDFLASIQNKRMPMYSAQEFSDSLEGRVYTIYLAQQTGFVPFPAPVEQVSEVLEDKTSNETAETSSAEEGLELEDPSINIKTDPFENWNNTTSTEVTADPVKEPSPVATSLQGIYYRVNGALVFVAYDIVFRVEYSQLSEMERELIGSPLCSLPDSGGSQPYYAVPARTSKDLTDSQDPESQAKRSRGDILYAYMKNYAFTVPLEPLWKANSISSPQAISRDDLQRCPLLWNQSEIVEVTSVERDNEGYIAIAGGGSLILSDSKFEEWSRYVLPLKDAEIQNISLHSANSFSENILISAGDSSKMIVYMVDRGQARFNIQSDDTFSNTATGYIKSVRSSSTDLPILFAEMILDSGKFVGQKSTDGGRTWEQDTDAKNIRGYAQDSHLLQLSEQDGHLILNSIKDTGSTFLWKESVSEFQSQVPDFQSSSVEILQSLFDESNFALRMPGSTGTQLHFLRHENIPDSQVLIKPVKTPKLHLPQDQP